MHLLVVQITEHESIILKRNANYSNPLTNVCDFGSRHAFENSSFRFLQLTKF